MHFLSHGTTVRGKRGGNGEGVTDSYLAFTNIKPLHKTTGFCFLTLQHFKPGRVLGFADFVVASTYVARRSIAAEGGFQENNCVSSIAAT